VSSRTERLGAPRVLSVG